MTLLPALPEQPEPPPMKLAEVIGHLRDSLAGSDWEAVDALLQFLDCRNVEAHVHKWSRFDDRAPRSAEALAERLELPEYMQNFLAAYEAGTLAGEYPAATLWRAYFNQLTETADRVGSQFLKEWVTWEVSLRNELARERADHLSWSIEPHLLDPLHGEPSHTELVVRLREAANPLDAQRKLDAAKLAAIHLMSGTDPFSLDAVLAYTASVLVLDGWDLPEAPAPGALLEKMRGNEPQTESR
jgi:hypothetical protein